MRTLTVAVETKAREKIEEFIDQVDTEIGGFLDVEQDGRVLIVHDAWVVKQEVTEGSVDFEPGEFERYLEKKGQLGKPMPHICAGVWHSHVDFGTGPSSIDEYKLVQKLACRGFLLNIIANKKGEWTTLVDSFVGPETGTEDDYVLARIPTTLEFWRSREMEDECTEQILQHVTRRKKEVKVTQVQKGNGWKGDARRLLHPGSGETNERPYAASVTGWRFDKETGDLVEFVRANGAIVKRVTNNGKGDVTVLSMAGEPLLKMKNKDASGIVARGMDAVNRG